MATGIWGALRAYFSDTEVAPVRIDASTHALECIDYPHHEIHAGSSFTTCITNTTTNSDDHRTLIGFETPAATKEVHLVVTVSASEPAEVFIYEDVTIDDDEGTEIDVIDRNRVTANTSAVVSFQASPVAGKATWMLEAEVAAAQFSAVTTIEQLTLVAGGGPQAIGGVSRGEEEYILAPAKRYAVVIQNIGSNINRHEIRLDWYEHTPKD